MPKKKGVDGARKNNEEWLEKGMEMMKSTFSFYLNSGIMPSRPSTIKIINIFCETITFIFKRKANVTWSIRLEMINQATGLGWAGSDRAG